MKPDTKTVPPPEKPDPYECCGSGCVPCIFDYYYDKLAYWQDQNGLTLEEYQKQQSLKIEKIEGDKS